MKDFLTSTLKEYEKKYCELVSLVERTHKTKQWGSGSMPAYNPAPYTAELQGCKPGRFLKKNAEPAQDKQCYFLDDHGKIIGDIQYTKYVKFKSQWIVYRRFFLNEPDKIIELKFGSAFEGEKDANLDSVSISAIEDSRTIVHYSLLNTGEYFETQYKYSNEKIVSVTENIWRETFTQRFYEVQHTDDAIVIFEILQNNNKLAIYPED